MTWPRDTFARAVWESDLTPTQRLVALAFADHAASDDFAFLTMLRGKTRTGLSQATLRRAIKDLADAGWLEVKELGGPKRATRYWLRTPGIQQSHSETPQQSHSETPEQFEQSHHETPAVSQRDPSSLTVSTDLSEDHSEGTSSIDAREAEPALALVPEPHREIVLQLIARLGADLEEQDAIDCVAWVFAAGKKNPGGYLSRFPLRDVRARAAEHRRSTGAPCSRCDGSGWLGENEAGLPIACLACRPHLAARPSRRGDIDWDAAMSRAIARDAAAEAAS